MPVYVINLDRDTVRMQQMAHRLGALGLAFQRVPGVVGRELTADQRAALYDEALNRRRYHAPLVDGEIGCYASHLRAWQLLLDDGAGAALVLEDDVEIMETLPRVLDALSRRPQGWDMVKLLGRHDERTRARAPLAPGIELIRYHRVPSLTGAYAISRQGAGKLLRARARFFRPIDVDLRHWWECELRLFGAYPYPARDAEAALASSIGGRDQQRGLARRLRKTWLQLSYSWQSLSANRRDDGAWPALGSPA